MLTSLANASVGHGRSSFLGFQLPLGVDQVQDFPCNSAESNIWVGTTSALPRGMQSLCLLNPWMLRWKHLNISACASKSRMIYLSGSVKFQRDMFDSDANVKKVEETAGCVDESQEDEEDVGLIPHQWRLLQDDLHKTKKEKKLDLRVQEHENAMRRAAELQRKRKELEDAHKLLKERVAQSTVSNQDTIFENMSHPFTRHNVVRQEITASFKVEEDNESSQALSRPITVHNAVRPGTNTSLKVEEDRQTHEPHERRRFDLELHHLFNEDEIACLKRSAPDLSKIYCEKWPPLQVLVGSGQFFFLDEFLKSDVNLNSVDEDGYTPIHRAILGRKETAVNQLLRAGADVNIHDKDGASFLHYSVQTGSLNLVRLFLKYGVDKNHADEDGWTALHVAALTAREDIVRHLLIRGADKHRKTKDGYTPFDICLAIGKGYRTFAVAKQLKRQSKENMSAATELELEEGSTSKKQRDAS
eukprot:c10547_g1_i1 orf=341-1759(-)